MRIAAFELRSQECQYHVRPERDGMQRRVHEEQLAPAH